MLTVVLLCGVWGCKKHKESPSIPIQFENSTLSLQEGASQSLKIKLASSFSTQKTITIKIEGSATYGANNDYILDPAPDTNNELIVVVPANTSSFTFATANVNLDQLVENPETIKFSFISLPEGIVQGESPTLEISVIDAALVNLNGIDLMLNEGQEHLPITLQLGESLPVGGVIKIHVSLSTGVILGNGKDLMIAPQPVTDTIIVQGNNTAELSFFISSFVDALVEPNETVTFSVSKVPSGFAIGPQNSVTVHLVDNTLGDGLVGEYLFNGNAFDTSGKGHHGVVTGATLATSRTGEQNASYYFNGASQHITVANNTDMNFSAGQDFSVSLWTNPSSTQNDLNGTINNIIRQWIGDAQGYPFTIGYLNLTHPSPRTFYGGRYGGSACGTGPGAISGTVTSDFHHVVLRKVLR